MAGMFLKELKLRGTLTRTLIVAPANLVPAYIRAFFLQAMEALAPGRVERRDDGFWRIAYVPVALREVPEVVRRRHGTPAESYPAITFDKADLQSHRGLAFVGPGQPLFEAVVHHVLARFGPDLAHGAVLRDPESQTDGLFWLLLGSVEDGLGRTAGKRLFGLFQPISIAPAGPQSGSPGARGQSGSPAWQKLSPARLLDFEAPAEPLNVPQAYRQRLAEGETAVDWSLTWPNSRPRAGRKRPSSATICGAPSTCSSPAPRAS
jgi:hypothetical protein